MRDTVLLAGAVVLGGVLAPSLMFAGFPIAAAGLAGLLWAGRTSAAAFAAGLAVALGAFLAPADVVLLVPVFVAMLFVITSMGTRSALQNVTVLTLVVGVAAVGVDVTRAWRAGTTLLLMRAEMVAEAISMATDAAGVDSGVLFGLEGPALLELMIGLWPADYFTTALVTATLAVGIAGWTATRSGRKVNQLPGLAALDLSPHVLWAFIGGLLMLAASRVLGEAWGWTFTAGVNLLIMVRLPLVAQGMGVAAAFYRKLGAGRFVRYTGYALLLAVEVFAPVISFLGLADFWVNFRKLTREDAEPTEAHVIEDDE